MAADLAAAGAAETVSDSNTLARAVSALLADRRLRAERAAAGSRVTTAGLGVLADVLVLLAPWLDLLAPMQSAADPPRCLRA
jgi:3-deoxy-D-manno-octulosonic-acid transferase